MKEEFKEFVKTKPELIDYVKSGEMTWQKFYEQWYLYGSNSDVWNKYTKKEENFSFSNILNSLKKIKADDVKKGVNNVQKIMEILGGLLVKDEATNATYEPRQLFKKFED